MSNVSVRLPSDFSNCIESFCEIKLSFFSEVNRSVVFSEENARAIGYYDLRDEQLLSSAFSTNTIINLHRIRAQEVLNIFGCHLIQICKKHYWHAK